MCVFVFVCVHVCACVFVHFMLHRCVQLAVLPAGVSVGKGDMFVFFVLDARTRNPMGAW